MDKATALGSVAQALAAGGATYLHCPCDDKELHVFPSKTIIRCPKCQTWQHKAHVDVDENDITAGIGYICKSCQILGDEVDEEVKKQAKNSVHGWQHLSLEQIQRLIEAEKGDMTAEQKGKLAKLGSFTKTVLPESLAEATSKKVSSSQLKKKKQPRKQKPGISPFLGLNHHDSDENEKRSLSLDVKNDPAEDFKKRAEVDIRSINWVAQMHEDAAVAMKQELQAANKAANEAAKYRVAAISYGAVAEADRDNGEGVKEKAKKAAVKREKTGAEIWVRRSSRHLKTNAEDIEIEDQEHET